MEQPVYGLDDAGLRWANHCGEWLVSRGFEKLETDPCIFVLRSHRKEAAQCQPDFGRDLEGIIGMHVDDFCCGGKGPRWEKA